MKALQVVTSAYRCNIEEQDDPVIWITHAMKGAGGDLGVLLRGDAVNYAIKGQDATGVTLGAWKQTQPPRIERDLTSALGKGIEINVVEEDAAERGIGPEDFITGVKRVRRGDLPKLFDRYDQVWHW